MYIPKHFELQDRQAIFDLMRQNSFATVVNIVDGLPFATHVPVTIRPDMGEMGSLRTHLARANPQWQAFAEDTEILLVFQGDHSYVSPLWYTKHPSVPTWVYMTVHVYAKPRIVSQPEEVKALLLEMVETYEGSDAKAWKMQDLPESYLNGMIQGIVAVELEITRMQGVLKLDQHKNEGDRRGVVEALQKSAFETERAVGVAMAQTSGLTQ
jgi:transcriptional regulator